MCYSWTKVKVEKKLINNSMWVKNNAIEFEFILNAKIPVHSSSGQSVWEKIHLYYLFESRFTVLSERRLMCFICLGQIYTLCLRGGSLYYLSERRLICTVCMRRGLLHCLSEMLICTVCLMEDFSILSVWEDIYYTVCLREEWYLYYKASLHHTYSSTSKTAPSSEDESRTLKMFHNKWSVHRPASPYIWHETYT